MSIKLIVWDFDNVLADLREVHYEALNQALLEIDSKYLISREEQISVFDGLSTKRKVKLLHESKGLPLELSDSINNRKQFLTIEMMERHLKHDQRLFDILQKLKNEGYLLYVASNAIRNTIETGLRILGIAKLFDFVLANEDVSQQKPHPQIYLKAIVQAGVTPDETLIVEDSKHGREAAMASGAHVCGVDNPADVTYEKVISRINSIKSKKIKWAGKDLNVLLPMAGLGSRFTNEGYKLPKPLIDVGGKPMIQRVVENLNIDANYIFLVQKAHYENYNLGVILPLMVPGCKIIQVDGLTEGAACTTLLAKEFINNEQHLLIANSDQLVDWDSCDFLHHTLSNQIDGSILTFRDNNPKWSYAKINNLGYVTELAEKQVISDIATVGIYFYNRGSEYVKYAEQMIKKDIRVNGEFYVAPVYNEYIADNKKIKTYDCQKMWGMGIPSDLQYLLENKDLDV